RLRQFEVVFFRANGVGMPLNLNPVTARVRQQNARQFAQLLPGPRFERGFVEIEQDVREVDDQPARFTPCIENLRERSEQALLSLISFLLGLLGLQPRTLRFDTSQLLISPGSLGFGLSLRDLLTSELGLVLCAPHRCERAFGFALSLRYHATGGVALGVKSGLLQSLPCFHAGMLTQA